MRAGKFLVALIVGCVALGVSGVASRRADDEQLARWTHAQAVPTVAVVSPKLDDTAKKVVLPGDVQAFYSAAIHAQVTGYVREWRKDIGAHVVKGEVLAVVDTPELDDSVTQAQGEVEKADADLTLAGKTAERWQALGHSSAVSQQAIDEKVGDEKAKQAELSAARANLARLKSQKAFATLTAPFDGVVTARSVDIGAYVNASANGGAPLFVVSDVSRMRVYVKAPQTYAAALQAGMTAKLRLPEYPGRTFDAKIATTSNAIDGKSRSLLVELLADNAQGELRPGSFAEVTFELPPAAGAQTLSAATLLFRDAATEVALIDAQGRVTLQRVRIARDTGSDVEIEGGLPPGARVALNPPESIADGDVVRIAGAPDDRVAQSAPRR